MPNAVVAGDPCLDRLTASLPLRQQYRRALGADRDTTVVTLTSTWGPNSLLGRNPELIDSTLAELPLDDHIVTAIIHPNVWFAHGPWQIRRWLADALRAGLRLIPPLQGWQATLIASDVVIGDHGAVTGYAAALSIPTLLASFPDHEVAPGSAAELVGRFAPRLDRRRALPEQLAETRSRHDSERSQQIAQRVSSRPGQCADVLRSTFYRMTGLAEPPFAAPVPPYPVAGLDADREPIRSCRISCDRECDDILLRSWPADVVPAPRRGYRATETYVAVELTHPRRDLAANADILVIGQGHTGREVLASHPAALMVVTVVASDRLSVLHRRGRFEIELPEPVDLPMWPALMAAASHCIYRRSQPEVSDGVAHIGSRRIPFRLKSI
ncbi:hypothetical protein FEK35_30355 [Nocardia cyriacigeorgica]|uniref:Uncharacterized protein n=1 Tax=Nocardia cyriacigeorgica TaxID=135487 RepID=A0A5R8P4N3_9NOCA|nr:hypothetical protein [Nocardia cyriacigeorgica]TLF92480.1 hypothetical protein FEK35_30355 [Nocardia cyriacigeorgica]